jgi:hypothetical protein
MTNWISILVLLGLLGAIILTVHLMISMTLDLISILDIPSILNGTWWEKNVTGNVTGEGDLILDKFPLGEERIFTGKYISHWEIATFELMSSVNCQLDIPLEGGWDWLVVALGNPTTREEYSGTFDLSFRGKIVEKGIFGHMGICTYRIEVIEILSATQIG